MSEQQLDAPDKEQEEQKVISQEQESTDIDFDIRKLDFNHLRRKHAFFAGVPIQAEEEYT